MRLWRRFEGVFGGVFWMRGFLWGGEEEEEEEEGGGRREGVDGKKGGEADETVFFVCGDRGKGKGKVT